jgi:hypothetical protein
MGQAIPRQQPAVVLRSHFNQLRALLAVVLIAVAGLTVAVVILAGDSDQVGSTSAARPTESVKDHDFSPAAAGRPEWLLPNWTPEAGLARDADGDWAHGPLPPEAPADDDSKNAASGD